MADLKGNKNRLTINLSLFAPNDHNYNKSPKSFEPNGNNIVGLGIVAAMNQFQLDHIHTQSAKSAILAVSAVSPRRSTTTTTSPPIPILVNTNTNATPIPITIGSKFGGGPNLEMELSEEYTCVISHIGNNLIKKREYFDDVLANESESSNWVTSGLVSASSPPPLQSHATAEASVFRTADFLNSCNLCRKQLHGLDIFMYRGEKAFCSAECRCKQISIDEHKEKCGSGAMNPLEYSVSPCSGPMQFLAGMAAA